MRHRRPGACNGHRPVISDTYAVFRSGFARTRFSLKADERGPQAAAVCAMPARIKILETLRSGRAWRRRANLSYWNAHRSRAEARSVAAQRVGGALGRGSSWWPGLARGGAPTATRRPAGCVGRSNRTSLLTSTKTLSGTFRWTVFVALNSGCECLCEWSASRAACPCTGGCPGSTG